ncbi:MAG: S1C family serine protease [Rhodospirillales bacterium]
MRLISIAFLTILMFPFCSGFSYANPKINFSGLKKSVGGQLIFTDIGAGTKLDGFAIMLEVSQGSDVEISYDYAGSSKKLLTRTFSKQSRVRIPEGNKFIYLQKVGTHNFRATVRAKNNLLIEKDLSIQINEEVSIPDLIDVKFTSAKYEKYNNRQEAENILLNHKPIKIGSLKTRGVGSKLYKELADSVVLILSKKTIGTGSIIDTNGTILTNWHVISGTKTVQVVFRPPTFTPVDRSEKIIADVIKVNEKNDLALIKLRKIPRPLIPIKLAKKGMLEVAMDVHAIGHPRGNFWTYTRGVLSQIRPGFKWSGGDRIKHEADVIQTQTPINPGNSGGPLLTNDSLMIGINSFIDSKAQGLNFAVAISTVKEFLKQKESLIRSEKLGLKSFNGKTVRVDRDKDGYKELWITDRNGNGVPDLFKIDKNKDQKPDVILFDKNENKIFELKITFVKHRGKITAVYALDKDEDGKVESYGFDYDLDGKIDKVQAA